MVKIESLTDAQKLRFDYYRQKWLAIGLSTACANRPEAERGVDLAYRAAGLEPPKIKIWLGSPHRGAIGAAFLASAKFPPVRDQVGDQVRAQVRDQVRDQVWDQVYRALWGQHDAGYYAFYDFMLRELVVKDAARLEGQALTAQNAGWWWPFNGAVILTERPSKIQMDERGRLHSLTGNAIEYPDGWGIRCVHGERVPVEAKGIVFAHFVGEKEPEQFWVNGEQSPFDPVVAAANGRPFVPVKGGYHQISVE